MASHIELVADRGSALSGLAVCIHSYSIPQTIVLVSVAPYPVTHSNSFRDIPFYTLQVPSPIS